MVRINAACRTAGISYSRFIDGLKRAGITLNRKMLAEIAFADEPGFRALVDKGPRRITAAGAVNDGSNRFTPCEF